MTLAAHGKRLEPDQQLLGRRGAEGASRVAEDLELAADGEGAVREALPELGLRVVELGKSIGVTAPVKGATIDDDATYRGAVAANPFGGRVNDNVYAVIDGTTEVSGTAKGVVALEMENFVFSLHSLQRVWVKYYDQWNALGVTDERKRLQVQDDVARVADALDPDELGPVINGSRKVLGVSRPDEAAFDAHLLGQRTELVKGAGVDVKRGDKVVARARESQHGHGNGCRAGCNSTSGHATFQLCHAVLEDIDSRLWRDSAPQSAPSSKRGDERRGEKGNIHW